MYFLGNLLEILSSPDHTTSDPPFIWVTGTLISLAVIGVSISKYRRFTTVLFKIFAYFINFNIVFSYASLTLKDNPDAWPYLFISYFVFIVTSQLLDSRGELVAITVAEVIFYAGAMYVCRDHHPALLQPMNLLILVFVLVGNFIISTQRMRLTQISGGSTIQFKAISESARDVQGIIDDNFKFIYINPAIVELSGHSFTNLANKELLSLVFDADHTNVKDTLAKIKESPDDKLSVEYRVIKNNGEKVWVESIFSGFKIGRNGKAELIFVETRNIETRKKLEENIQQQLHMEEMLIKHSNQFINVGRTEIQNGIDVALGEFGSMLKADIVMVYRMHGKIQDEFRCTNEWVGAGYEELYEHFSQTIKINQQLVAFLRALRGDKASHGNFFTNQQLYDIQTLNKADIPGYKFYLVPLQSGNIANGFMIFGYKADVQDVPVSVFGLVGNMVSSAFTRMRTELRLHEAQQTNESILRALPDWLYIINKNGEFTGTNNATTLPDYIPDYGLIGKTFADVMPVEISLSFTEALSQVMETEIAASFEYYDNAIYKDRFFKAIIAPFKTSEYLVIIRDITDLKQAQIELVSKAKKLEISNKELEEFAYVVSHDMKQPIRTIISYLSLLKKKHMQLLPPDGQEFVNFSIDGANKMSDLIRDILQYSRLDQQLKMEPEVSLNNVVTKVKKALNEIIIANNAEIFCDDLPTITGNETMLTELFQNLIENGIKYNKSDKKVVKVEVAESPTEWLFRITDNGIGFDQQYAQQIFKMFKRLHTDGEFQGTGIGLSICQKVVEKHGGQIWAESVKGEGSKFNFTFPKYG